MAFIFNKRPVPVEQIVSGGGNDEADAVGDVFLNFQHLFTQSRYAKVHNRADGSNETELQKLGNQCPCYKIKHDDLDTKTNGRKGTTFQVN